MGGHRLPGQLGCSQLDAWMSCCLHGRLPASWGRGPCASLLASPSCPSQRISSAGCAEAGWQQTLPSPRVSPPSRRLPSDRLTLRGRCAASSTECAAGSRWPTHTFGGQALRSAAYNPASNPATLLSRVSARNRHDAAVLSTRWWGRAQTSRHRPEIATRVTESCPGPEDTAITARSSCWHFLHVPSPGLTYGPPALGGGSVLNKKRRRILDRISPAMGSGDLSQAGVSFLPKDGAHRSHVGSHSLPQGPTRGNPMPGQAGHASKQFRLLGLVL